MLELKQFEMPNGMKINAIAGDTITGWIKKEGVYEKALYTFLKDFLSITQGAVCADIGANIGNHALTMAKYSSEVFAFEPVPFIYEILSSNKTLNSLNNLQLNQIALGNEEGEVEMLIVNDINSGCSRISAKGEEQEGRKKEKARIVKGDDFFSEESVKRIDLIKIDVEGHETDVLLGLENTIKQYEPIVVFEWNDELTKNGFKKNQFFDTVFKNYSLYELTDSHTLYRRQMDGKFFRSVRRKWFNLTQPYKSCLRAITDLDKNYGSLILVPGSSEKMSTIFNNQQLFQINR